MRKPGKSNKIAQSVLVFLSVLLLSTGCNQKNPNVVFILVDQWRGSATGYAGDPNVKTPNLDLFANEAVTFTNAVSVCPVCTPYRASILTGRYPTSTGMFLNDAYLPAEELCLAEVFKENGYHTGYIGKWHLDGQGRFDFTPPERRQGFDYWKALECSHNYYNMAYYEGDSPEVKYWEGYSPFAVAKDAEEYITRQSMLDDPFFLFVSIAAPHFPHQTAPDEFKALYSEKDIRLNPNIPKELHEQARKELVGYYAHCSATDQAIGGILDKIKELDLMKETIVVFTSDHGEIMGAQGIRIKQKQVPWNESAGVPLIISYPSKKGIQNRMINMPVTTPDISTSLLALAGLEIPESFEGEDFSEIIQGKKELLDHGSLYMSVAPFASVKKEFKKEYRALKTSQFTYVKSIEGPWLLYDDIEDPYQMNNLVSNPEYKDVLTILEKQLVGELEEIGDDFRPAEYYISKWGFNVTKSGHIPYQAYDQEPQSPSQVTLSKIKENFQSPPQEYGVNCWWWWLNGNVTEEGITKDLEAMKSRNFHGAMIFDAGGHNHRGNKDIPDGPLYGSAEWNELFVFALDEARRLSLEMGFNIQSGWNLGGPRVTPQYAAKQITNGGIVIQGGKKISRQLELPPNRKDFYKDIAILAVPLKDESTLISGISDLSLKLGFSELGGSAPDCRFLLTNTPRNPNNPDVKPTVLVKKADIIDLTHKMDTRGLLNWDAPVGDWMIIRIGYTCTNSHVSTSSNQWQGLVLDYMSKEAFHFYWDDVVAPIFEAAGDHIGTTLKYLETDSWECGGMNWTDQFAAEFKKYRGYDILSYLPVLAGIVVDDIETSNAFLADFRKTLGDLVAYNHYALFADYADKYNMGIQPESAGPHAGPMDGIKNYGFSEIVMSEFWSPSPHRPRPENRYFLKQASSAAHIYGKRIVGAESFTTIGPQWNDELWHDQKSAFDHEICAGLNRLYFHTFTASPKEMGLPGQEYFAGTHVNPQVTWWDQSGAFIDYMHRTQLLVQNGKFVADVLYYYGDHVPNVFSIKATDPAGAMPGYDYDVCDETILLQLKMKKDKIVVPGGIEYEVLVLPDHRTLSMAALRKVEELLKAGAHVIGHKPEQLVSRVGGEDAQEKFHALADEIWGGDNGEKGEEGEGGEDGEKGEKRYGKGYLAWGITAREYLLSKDIPRDFVVIDGKDQADFDYIHYTIDLADVYFITNQTTDRKLIDCQFRVSELQPELWDALTGEIREAKAFTQKDGLTNVSLTLEPYGAVFVIFSKEIKETQQGTEERNYHDFESLQTINGEWKVNFDPKWGPFDSSTLRPLDPNQKPGAFIFPELMDWSEHSNEAIKYYSGSAVYHKLIDLDFDLKEDQKYYLQLGSVKDVGIAVVKVNGQDLGVTWTSPFRVDVSDVLKPGRNELEIKVINSWYNRVAGDEILELEQPYTSTNIVIAHDFRGRKIENIQLEPSGLIGPVELLQEKQN